MNVVIFYLTLNELLLGTDQGEEWGGPKAKKKMGGSELKKYIA
jgi:hypothetical protein